MQLDILEEQDIEIDNTRKIVLQYMAFILCTGS